MFFEYSEEYTKSNFGPRLFANKMFVKVVKIDVLQRNIKFKFSTGVYK